VAPLVPPEVPPLELPPAVPADEPPDEALGLDVDDEPEEDDDPEPVVDVVLVVAVEVLSVEVMGGAAALEVGTVSGGAPVVSVAGDPPPQAATPAQAAAPAIAENNLLDAVRRRTTVASDVERIHPPAAMWAVVQILLAQLITPIAESEVFHRPRQLRRRRRERQELSDDFQRLARFPVDVRAAELGVDHHLPTGGRRAHAVPLARPHSEAS
jgi:hypothetical protein